MSIAQTQKINHGHADDQSSANYTVVFGSAPTVGQLIVVCIGRARVTTDTPLVVTAPEGFSLAITRRNPNTWVGAPDVDVWTKVAGASEPNSYLFAWGSSVERGIHAAVFSGATGVGATGSNAIGTDAGSILMAASALSVAAGSYVFGFVRAHNGAQWTTSGAETYTNGFVSGSDGTKQATGSRTYETADATVNTTVTRVGGVTAANLTSVLVELTSESASTGPVIGSNTVTAETNGGFTLNFTTDTGNGTAYYVVYPTSATLPTAAQIQAGTDGDNVTAVAADSQTIGSTGAKSFEVTGLNPGTSYGYSIVHYGTPA
jgi:hypothetical protein